MNRFEACSAPWRKSAYAHKRSNRASSQQAGCISPQAREKGRQSTGRPLAGQQVLTPS